MYFWLLPYLHSFFKRAKTITREPISLLSFEYFVIFVFYRTGRTVLQELLPSGLLVGLAAQREGVPFPAFVEALLMEITFKILREAGVRMPRAIGQSVSIVGTLVIGQAAGSSIHDDQVAEKNIFGSFKNAGNRGRVGQRGYR